MPLLKTLEEPPPRSVLILIGTTPGQATPHDPLALPTDPLSAAADRDGGRTAGVEGVRGRRGRGPAAGPVQRREPSAGVGTGRSRAVVVSQHAATSGSAEPMLTSVALAQMVAAFVDEAGKEAVGPPRPACGRSSPLPPSSTANCLHAQCGVVAVGGPASCGARWPGDRARARRSRASRPRGWIAVSTPPPRSTATPTNRR